MAQRFFRFIRRNDNHVTVLPGMSAIVTGLDKPALMQIAPMYGIELDRFEPFITIYENELLKQQRRLHERK